MSRKDRIYILVAIVLLLLLCAKSLILDPYSTSDPAKNQILQEYKKSYEKVSLLGTIRITGLKELTESDIKVLEDESFTPKYKYKAKFRKYYLYVFPYKDGYFTISK